MILRLFTLASVVSLLLCVATVVVWVGLRDFGLAVGNHYTTGEIDCHNGRVTFSLWKYSFDVQAMLLSPRHWIRFRGDGWIIANVDTRGFDGGVFAAVRDRYFEPTPVTIMTRYRLMCPSWFLAVTFSIMPAYWLIRWRRLNQAGGCLSCGYNLTGNISGVCPECGMAVAGK